jgi:small subunit ribosomal protein S17
MNDQESHIATPIDEKQTKTSSEALRSEEVSKTTDESRHSSNISTTTTHGKKRVALKRSLRGTVVSDAMDKTIVVEVSTLKTHPKYRKQYATSKRYHVHDPKNQYHVGERLEIMPMRPISKKKRWYVSKKLS